jgi:hypothetical protein
VPLDATNDHDALLASGTIPLVCVPVRDIAGAPHGNYWDGALIDYHLLLPYPWLATHKRTDRSSIVLYRHFDRSVTPGWLDKHLPWRRSSSGHAWLANVLNRAIGVDDRAYPNRKLPDRQDFYRYGTDHAGRERAWNRAIGESERFAEAVLQ